MSFKYDFSDELEATLMKLYKKDKKRYGITIKKIEEIAERDIETINFYKNLRHDLKNYKRVHIDRVLYYYLEF